MSVGRLKITHLQGNREQEETEKFIFRGEENYYNPGLNEEGKQMKRMSIDNLKLDDTNRKKQG